jgi:hypothetical protein
MPNQVMVQNANEQLAAQSAARIVEEYPEEVEALGQRGTLIRVAEKVLQLGREDLRYLEAMPSALREAIRATIYDGLAEGKSIQLQYSPAYDFSVQVWDYGEAVSVHVSGPYETDGYSKRPDRYTSSRQTAAARTTKRRTTARKSAARKPARRKTASRGKRRAR